MKKKVTTRPGVRALSLFSGGGGFCEGMHQAGVDVIAAVEKDPFSCETYRYNFPETKLFEGDIANFTSKPIEELETDFGLKDIDIVFGGPPCQGYSQIGTRDLDDPRNQLYREFIRTLVLLRPSMFVMENVPNMLLLKQGMFRDAALKEFADAGYPTVAIFLLDASEFGVPQQRRRVFYVGIRKDLTFPHDLEEFFLSMLEGSKVSRPVTVWQAIGDLPEAVVPSGGVLPYPPATKPNAFMRDMRLDLDGDIYDRKQKMRRGMRHHATVGLHNHHTKEIQQRRLSLIKMLRPGAKADSLPKAVWNGSRPEKWRRLHPDQPAYTLLANMHRDLSEFVHPKHHRWITVREALRLQSFHDGFIPVTSEWQQLKQIGNAVPPLLARAVGSAVLDVMQELRGLEKKDFRPRGSQLALFVAAH